MPIAISRRMITTTIAIPVPKGKPPAPPAPNIYITSSSKDSTYYALSIELATIWNKKSEM